MKHFNSFRLFCLSALLPLCLASCWLPPMLMPADIDTPEPIDLDTVPVVDTLPIIDTCVFPELVLEPAFVTGYMWITDDLQTDRQIIIGTHSAWIYSDNQDQIGHIIDSLLTLWKPQYEYTVYVNDDDSRKIAIIVDGTNDREQFYLGAQIRYNGYKQYFGWVTQGYVFAGALTLDEYAAVIDQYPSVDVFNYMGTDYDSTDYIKLSYQILGVCKHGRWYANFRLGPYEMIDTVVTQFDAVFWQTVLHIPDMIGTTVTLAMTDDRHLADEVIYWQDQGASVLVFDSSLTPHHSRL